MAPYLDINSSSSGSGSSSPQLPSYDSQNETEPIAIIGMGCRLPGGVNNPQDLWNMLVDERSGQCDTPASRWNINSYYHPDPDRPASLNTKGGYFLKDDIRQFENSFFGINNLEATYMDPQQRKLLEVCYECFESAGTTLEDVSGANIGCYVGNFTIDYIVMQAKEAEYFHRYNATGMGTTILANRISHVFNLTGPSVVLDTACSSSLYAVHMACAALDAGECESAIAAGANIMQSPEQHIGTMRAGVLSGTSTCHTFDSSADGYGRADGVGAVYLKKLNAAMRDNDPIRAVIRGSAVNSNGKTNGITLPSADGQEAVIRKAYAKAGLEKLIHETKYVECHGTGTPVGDPIEVEAVSRVFQRKSGTAPLLIGSVKTNLGHSEAASGFSSMFKVAMALEKQEIPATIGVVNVNPKIKTDEWGVKIVTKSTAWPSNKSDAFTSTKPVRRAGINSFGYGGANSHLIMEAAESYMTPQSDLSSEQLSLSRSKFILPFSASSPSALQLQVSALHDDPEKRNVVDLAYTLGVRRSQLSNRGFLIASQRTLKDDLSLSNLTQMSDGSYSTLPFAFVFTGQGAQWAQMGKELIEEFPSFRKTIVELDNVLQTLRETPSWTLRQAILETKDTSQINHVTRSQPVCTAIQIAYIDLLARWGISPEAVIGHSSGEIGAAYASGFLSARDAIIVAYYRGYVVGKSNNPTQGGMLAAGIGRESAQSYIDELGLGNAIRVACVNSPESVTISGDLSGVTEITNKLQSLGLFARKLNTDGRAYHSHHMAHIGQEYEELLRQNLSRLPIKQQHRAHWISSVTGEAVSGKVLPSYWRRNLESPVLFSDALEGILKLEEYHLVEVGPHSALEMPIKQTKAELGSKKGHYSSVLTRGRDAVNCVLNFIGQLFLHGHNVKFGNVNYVEGSITALATGSSFKFGSQGKVIPNLPSYPWTYDGLLWSESRSSIEYRNKKYPHHDLLGTQKPGGDGLQTTWRNVLKTTSVPWLDDHKLEETVVFPGAGFIAMAIEAVTQATNTKASSLPFFKLRQVQILKALALPGKNEPGVELFTVLRPTALSGASNSSTWWNFEISSFSDDKSTTHATGLVSITEKQSLEVESPLPADLDLEALAIRNWYGQFIKSGLNFGPAFTSLSEIKTPRSKKGEHALGRTTLLQGGGEGKTSQSKYIIHPITIDAMLQAGIIASTSGIIKALSAKIPTTIEELSFQTPQPSSDECWFIDAAAVKAGFATHLITTKLYDNNGQVLAHMKDARITAYQGISQKDETEEREPMLRVLWKPDVTLLADDGLTKYVDSWTGKPDFAANVNCLAAALDLLAHQNPSLRILELDSQDTGITEYLMQILKVKTPFKRFKSYWRGHLTDSNDLLAHEVVTDTVGEEKNTKTTIKGDYDVLVLHLPVETSDGYLGKHQSIFSKLLSSGGKMLSISSEIAMQKLLPGSASSIKHQTSTGATLSLTTLNNDNVVKIKSKKVIIVEEQDQSAFNDSILPRLTEILGQDFEVQRVLLGELTALDFKPKTTIISTIELTRPVMSTLTSSEMVAIKLITDNALNLIWITGGNNIEGAHPDFALISGLSRALMLEQPSLRFFTLDMDVTAPATTSTEAVLAVLNNALTQEDPDFEYSQKNGVLHVSRFVPDEGMNDVFRQKQGAVPGLEALAEIRPAKLMIKSVGQFETISFEQNLPDLTDLQPGTVEVQIKSVGLNAKDFYALAGKVDTVDASCTLDCSGVVTKVASNGIQRLSVGDRVVVMAPGHFETNERFPEWACQKLQDDEDFNTAATLPLTFATALYALRHRANIQEGESVLIHSAAGGLGIAAVQIAQLSKAEIFATVSTEDKKDFLVNNFGLKRENIFNSRDISFLDDVMAATNGRGVDVVLNSLIGDLLHASWRACASFGRFIEVGKRDIVDAGKLDMEVFRRNVTFTAFDLTSLYYEPKQTKIWARQKAISAVEPLKIFDISEITQAYRYFGLGNRIGKVAISLQNDKSLVQALPRKFASSFSPEKTYLMIGCLGGLGRSISKWMVKRGAKKFVFIGRSGTDREPARLLVDDLTSSGAEIQVVRGDVGVYDDVTRAVALIDGPVGGVIQAAMGLDEALWTNMSNEYWHTGIDPKLVGSWNLYNAVKSRANDLDFFMMTSSVSGSVGTATEGNYCAANYFLDVFSRFLKSQGIPGVSLGLGMISEVGYLHENPDIEALLLRKGIQAINEDELLQIIDISLSFKGASSTIYDINASGHILTGLEPLGLKLLRKQGFTGTNPTLNDPRANLLASALDSESDANLKSSSGLPAELADAIAKGGEDSSVLEAVVSLVLKRFSNLVLLPLDKIDASRELAKFGMDSMLAAEFRTWFYQAFKVDIPFFSLLAKTTTLNVLAEMVAEQVLSE
ncbi:Reducing polyketide synthase DEP5 [Lachnellula suecica]|uniref:Reducing polyketide synthase DEP5 n=1 Tax=Lachnellula suecica TaxID=602035 RepID=A0A8T9CFK0_9HELO|nr:Reducing polyketide synthase DEP5 [Lachnellula suecica]